MASINPISLIEGILPVIEKLAAGEPQTLGPYSESEDLNLLGKTYVVTETVTVTIALKA